LKYHHIKSPIKQIHIFIEYNMRLAVILLTVLVCIFFCDFSNAISNCSGYTNLNSCIERKNDYCAYCYVSDTCIQYDPCLGNKYNDICSNYTINPHLNIHSSGLSSLSCYNYTHGWVGSTFILMYIAASVIGLLFIFCGISLLFSGPVEYNNNESTIDRTANLYPILCGIVSGLYGSMQIILAVLCNVYYNNSNNITDYNYYISTIMAITFWSSNVGLFALLFLMNCLAGLYCLLAGNCDPYCQFIRKWYKIIRWRCCRCCNFGDHFDPDQYYEL